MKVSPVFSLFSGIASVCSFAGSNSAFSDYNILGNAPGKNLMYGPLDASHHPFKNLGSASEKRHSQMLLVVYPHFRILRYIVSNCK